MALQRQDRVAGEPSLLHNGSGRDPDSAPASVADKPLVASTHCGEPSPIPTNCGGERLEVHRVYFNSKAAAPNCWSVDQGTIESEIIVASVQLIGVNLVSRLNLAADNVHDPRAWFEVRGRLSVHGRDAVIDGGKDVELEADIRSQTS